MQRVSGSWPSQYESEEDRNSRLCVQWSRETSCYHHVLILLILVLHVLSLEGKVHSLVESLDRPFEMGITDMGSLGHSDQLCVAYTGG
ncbi:hypothetical protein K504DRAFT_80123 [Pleomassaria siparia CBS 279.74]|uniref:Uncharacterized protein n=1 Tax=Pleomassaria siparia CBS 279.74 TaxID=1314801 RepID=A0A6G1K1J2_9PLEO|nr:hypothetical protein K504DRAFT_80123 [Pleomassaria siparia CBS 279.74]